MAITVTKFFRKYNKAMLAIFTVVLMVAFLVPTTLKELFQSNPYKQVVGKGFGKDIYRFDLIKTSQRVEVLDLLTRQFSAMNPKAGRAFNLDVLLQFSPENQRVMNYYLLIREAQKMGIEITDDQVDRTLIERNVPPELINGILSGSQISLNDFRRAIGDYLSVEKVFELAVSAIKISEPEIQTFFKQTNERLNVEILPVRAEDFLGQVPVPTEKELAPYFVQNEKKFEYPPRVEIEYLGADLDKIKEGITISRDRAKQYWQEHKGEFTLTTQPATPKGTTTAPSSKPAPIKVEMTQEQALPKVIEKLKYEKARDLAAQAMMEARHQMEIPWIAAPTDKAGLKQKPDKVADYQKLADQLSKQFHVQIIYYRSPLLSQQDAAGLPGIGASFIPEKRQPLYFSDYAFRVVPLYAPPVRKSVSEQMFLVPYQNSSGLLRQMGDNNEDKGFYLFRVIKADPRHLPQSLAEVKDKVTKEYQLDQAYKIAKQNAEEICQTAGKQKLSQVIKTPGAKLKKIIATLGVKSIEPQTFSRENFSYGGQLVPPTISLVQGDTAKFAQIAFDKLWSQPTTQPNGTLTCAVIPMDENRSVYAVQFLEKTPATAEDFKQYKPFLARILLMTKQREFIQDWFAPENIHRRTQFVSSTTNEEEME
ncbi:MAG: hypothetical protein WC975_09535 [Phycisphaerae bacterium]